MIYYVETDTGSSMLIIGDDTTEQFLEAIGLCSLRSIRTATKEDLEKYMEIINENN